MAAIPAKMMVHATLIPCSPDRRESAREPRVVKAVTLREGILGIRAVVGQARQPRTAGRRIDKDMCWLDVLVKETPFV